MLDVLNPGPVTLPDGRRVDFANLDLAATAPCLRVVADAVTALLPWYGSVNRGTGALSQRSTEAYERARATVAGRLGAGAGDIVVFTRNTTDALNLLARAVPPGTTVLTFDTEHHANQLPWADARRLPPPRSPAEAVQRVGAALAGIDGPALVAVTAAGNVTGELYPVAELAAVAHRHGARLAVDAAQLAPHAPVTLAHADYVAFSGHKIYAPFGAGVLAGPADWLDAAPPYLAGGGATAHVADSLAVRWATGPARHEAGTPNLPGAVALATALDALAATDRSGERALVARFRRGIAGLAHVEELRQFGPDADRVGIVSFAVLGVDPHEFGAALGRDHGIGVRTGLFCAHPLSRRLLREAAARLGSADVPTAAVRASFGLGTRPEHVDRLLGALHAIAPAAVRAAA